MVVVQPVFISRQKVSKLLHRVTRTKACTAEKNLTDGRIYGFHGCIFSVTVLLLR